MSGSDSSAATVAAAAFRAGRPAVTRSFRFHRPRGAPCGERWCGLCEVDTPEGRALACRVAGPLPRRLDPLRPFGLAAERLPPWFYERHALRRSLALHALRRLSAAAGLGPTRAANARPYREEEVDVAIVGRDGNVGGIALGVYGDRTLGVLREGELVAVRFDRLVLATGSYDRLPPVPGNDLPGVIGLRAFEAYAAQGAFAPGTRVAVWGPPERVARAGATAHRHSLVVAYSGSEAPRRLLGRRRVEAIELDARLRCDVFVAAVAQPALELAAQAGARLALAADDLPVLVARDAPGWLELRGGAAATGSRVPDVRPADDAFACLCEDVRVRDVRAAVAAGFAEPELVKRRTGAMTGPCQGKLCAAAVLALLREAGAPHEPTTARPPARAVTLGELAAADA